jgi:hypothetical protein
VAVAPGPLRAGFGTPIGARDNPFGPGVGVTFLNAYVGASVMYSAGVYAGAGEVFDAHARRVGPRFRSPLLRSVSQLTILFGPWAAEARTSPVFGCWSVACEAGDSHVRSLLGGRRHSRWTRCPLGMHMRCKVCGHHGLIETAYRVGQVTAPAQECERCHAIQLDERLAKSEQDLDSVRQALAARQAAVDTYSDSGMHRTATGTLPVGQVDAAIGEIELLLAHVRVALEFLSATTHGETAKAVADVQGAVQRMDGIIDDLGKRCARAIATEAIPRTPRTGTAS